MIPSRQHSLELNKGALAIFWVHTLMGTCSRRQHLKMIWASSRDKMPSRWHNLEMDKGALTMFWVYTLIGNLLETLTPRDDMGVTSRQDALETAQPRNGQRCPRHFS